MMIEVQTLFRRHDTGDEPDVILFGSRGQVYEALRDEIDEWLADSGEDREQFADADALLSAYLSAQTIGIGSWWELYYQDITYEG